MSKSEQKRQKIRRKRAKRAAAKKQRKAEQLDAYREYKDVVLGQFEEILDTMETEDNTYTPAERKRMLRRAWAATRRQEGLNEVGTKA